VRNAWLTFGPLTRHRLLKIVAWTVAYLVAGAVALVVVHVRAADTAWPDAASASLRAAERPSSDDAVATALRWLVGAVVVGFLTWWLVGSACHVPRSRP